MRPEAAFLTAYALALVLMAAGIGALGRRPTHPWASRMLAGGQPHVERRADPAVDWPHAEVPVFHLGVSAVILAAAAMLTVVSTVRYSGPTELMVQLTVLLVIAGRAARLVSVRRTLAAHAGQVGGRRRDTSPRA